MRRSGFWFYVPSRLSFVLYLNSLIKSEKCREEKGDQPSASGAEDSFHVSPQYGVLLH